MTVENPNRMWRALAPMMAVAVALALPGCAATHIGEDWQCPLAQGARCVSVASADPAVPDAGPAVRGADPAARGAEPAVRGTHPVARRPVVRRADTRASAGVSRTNAETGTAGARRDCPAFCRPFRWLARLLEAEAGRDPSDASAPANGVREPAANDPATEAGAHKGEPSGDADASPPHTPLRLPETVGRVWIAPYVDAHGVYREASWVRVVIAPAAWRTP